MPSVACSGWMKWISLEETLEMFPVQVGQKMAQRCCCHRCMISPLCLRTIFQFPQSKMELHYFLVTHPFILQPIMITYVICSIAPRLCIYSLMNGQGIIWLSSTVVISTFPLIIYFGCKQFPKLVFLLQIKHVAMSVLQNATTVYQLAVYAGEMNMIMIFCKVRFESCLQFCCVETFQTLPAPLPTNLQQMHHL